MKTPFDTALRLQQREIDRVGMAIGAETGKLVAIEKAREDAIQSAIAEVHAAAIDPMMSSFAYVSRMRSLRERLEHDRVASAARLDSLRDEAMEVFGSKRAMETAAESFRAAEERAAATAEQAMVDDLSTAALLRARRLAAQERGR
ncbi:hypothetical protein E2493_16845 [Sphingomonas parva]|uniref:Flagellar FliJ protein n=1 Tax=Sphingomonas parva TaxID=2555898 RepID=A0A4Y8ZM73_9SPHN|nr:hypothetical protein [Sphingomonas parva]TFI57098.1 hypothetical protein E2493_16845 [Sphingomonas parva]